MSDENTGKIEDMTLDELRDIPTSDRNNEHLKRIDELEGIEAQQITIEELQRMEPSDMTPHMQDRLEAFNNLPVITSFKQMQAAAPLYVEELPIEGIGIFYIRELNGAAVSELMKRAPNILKNDDGEITINSTNRLSVEFVVSRSMVVPDANGKYKLMAGGSKGEKEFAGVTMRILRPAFRKALSISNLDDPKNDKTQSSNSEATE